MALTKNSFTLIEILVSVVIIAVVYAGLLQLGINQGKMISFLDKKSLSPLLLSFVSNHYDKKQSELEKNFLDEIQKIYYIPDTSLKDMLRPLKFEYKQALFDKINLSTDNNKTSAGILEFHKQSVRLNKVSAYTYRIKAIKNVE